MNLQPNYELPPERRVLRDKFRPDHAVEGRVKAAGASAGAVKAIGLDLDGTLFDHRGSATDGVRAFLRGLGVAPSDKAVDLWFAAEEAEFEHWRAGRISFQEQRRCRLRSVLTTLETSFDDEPAALDRLFDQYLSEYRRAWRSFSDVDETLHWLRGSGYRLGLLTNGSEAQQMSKFTSIGLDGLFDVVCVSEAIGVQKPDVEAFETLARALEVPPSQCLFVGDSPEQDIAGAMAAGMRASLIDRHGAAARGLRVVIQEALA